MKLSSRRFYLAVGAACALVASVVAAAVVLTFSGTSEAAPSRAEYFANIAAICRVYGPKLDALPAPTDIAIPGAVASSVAKALPILRSETRAVRALQPPADLRTKVARWLALNDHANASLASALRRAREPDVGKMGAAYVQFLQTGAAAERLGKQIGFPRPPC